MSAVELSVVIPAWNAAATIAAQLEALSRQRWSGAWEAVVADNGSTDGTAAIVGEFAARHPWLRLVEAASRRGPAAARNAGVAGARGWLIAFCDADDVVGEGWVRAMGEGLRRFPALTGPQEQERLNPPWSRNVYGSAAAGALQTFAGIFPVCATANLGVRREAFERLGGFDADVSVGEDLEFCLRLWHAGYELGYSPEAAVHYRQRAGAGALWRQALRYGAAGPMICSRLDALGLPRPPAWRGLRNWVWLARRLPTLTTRRGRFRWIAVAGTTTGRLFGSMRRRRVFL